MTAAPLLSGRLHERPGGGPTPLPAVDLSGVPTQLLLGGRWAPAADGATMPVVDPATGEVLLEVADASTEDALAAVAAAGAAQTAWGRTPPQQRAAILRRAAAAMREQAPSLAQVMTLEMGKTLAEARGEVAYAADFFDWFAEEAVRIDGGYAHRPDGCARTLQVKQPVGPCLLITPWNFPLAMGARKIGAALAAGCTVVLKPAPQTPLSSLALAQILLDAGTPEGVLSVLPGSRAGLITPPMIESGVICKLSFTGSTAVGKVLLAQCATQVIRTSMELGGNAPFIVLADADLEVAVNAAFDAKMRNMGEACTAANRFFVHRSLADGFVSGLAAKMAELRVGPGLDPSSQLGPMIDGAAKDKIEALVADAVRRGARVVTGGGVPAGPGFFVAPTVLVDVDADAALTTTEIFGPVAAVQTFDDVDDVVRRANDTPWGLVAYVITSDVDAAFDVAERLEVGMVGLNTGVVSTPSAPFGGVKQSGLGREGGRQGIEEYLETKYISMPVRR